MMILKNKLCGSASSARQGLSDPTTNLFYYYTCMCKMGKNRIGGVGKKHSLIVLLGWHYTAPFLHSFIFSGCKALFLIDNVPQV